MSTETSIQNLKQSAVLELIDGTPSSDGEEVRPRVHRLKALWQDKDHEQKFLINNLIPSGAVTIIIGDDGIGKTQLLTSLGLAIAFEEDTWLNMPLNVTNHGCMVVATEDSKEKFTGAMVKQIKANYLNKMTDDYDPDFFFMEGAEYDGWKEFTDDIELHVKNSNLELVIIDALSDLFGLVDGDINDNSTARKILKKLQSIADTHQIAVVVTHHAAKTAIRAKHKEGKIFVEKFDCQGASAITQKSRTVLALSNEPKSNSEDGRFYTNFLHVVKANLMGKHFSQNAIKLSFDTWNLSYIFEGEINIELYETELANEAPVKDMQSKAASLANRAEDGSRKRKPDEYELDEHMGKLDAVFDTFDQYLDRNEIVDKLSGVYGVGKVKIEQHSGFLNYLIEINLVLKYGHKYKRLIPKTEPETAENYIQEPDFNDFTIKPDLFNSEENAPF